LRYKYEDIKYFLSLEVPSIIKGNIWTFLFLIDFLGIIPLLDDLGGYTMLNLRNIAVGYVVVIIMLNIWGLYILLTVGKSRKLYSMFVGIYCVVFAILFINNAVKFMAQALNNTFPKEFLIYAIIIFVLVLILQYYFVDKALRKGDWKDGMPAGSKKGGILAAIVAVGLIAGRMYFRYSTYNVGLMVTAFAMLLVAYGFELGTQNIYKYYLMNKYGVYKSKSEISKKMKKH
jgi:hypothetical protein